MADLGSLVLEVASSGRTGGDLPPRPAAPPQADEGPSLPAEAFAAVIAEKTRLRVWAEAIRSSELGGSFMVLRPAPEWPKTDYPSAAAAYSELSKVVDQL